MRVCVLRWAIVFLCVAVSASAQESENPDSSSNASPGSAIAVPLPDSGDLRLYEMPELGGSEVARGSFLVNGRLPRPVVDYLAVMAGIRQRISIFENGIVSVSMTGTGGTIRKKMMVPADALEKYRQIITVHALDLPDEVPHQSGPTSDQATLRIYREDGTPVERRFNPSVVQGFSVSKPLIILNDLLRALAEDREVTNPMTGYTPRVGDHLIADDEQTYRVVRIIAEGKYVELASTREPLTLYVATKDLQKYFIGRRRAAR